MTAFQAPVEDALRDHKLVFLVGAPRSGTTWLQLLLSRSPPVRSLNVSQTCRFFGVSRVLYYIWNAAACAA